MIRNLIQEKLKNVYIVTLLYIKNIVLRELKYCAPVVATSLYALNVYANGMMIE